MAFGYETASRYAGGGQRRRQQPGLIRAAYHVPHGLEVILRQRAERAARQHYRPEIRALKAQRAGIRRTYRQSVQSTQNAVGMAESQLAKVQRSLKGSGLKGVYLRQTAQDLASRRSSLAQAIPFLTQEAAQQKQSDLASLQKDIIDARVQQQQAAGDKLYSLEGSAITRRLAMAKQRATNQREARGKHADRREALHKALGEAHLLYQLGPKRDEGEAWTPPWTNKEQWVNFVMGINHGEGVTSAAIAEEAAKRFAYHILNRRARHSGYGGVSPDFFERWLRAQLQRG